MIVTWLIIAGAQAISDAQTELISPTVRAKFNAGHSVEVSSFSSDGRWFALGTRSGDVGLLDMRGAQNILWLEHRRKSINAMAFTRDNATLAAGGDDGSVSLIHIPDGASRLLNARGARKIFALAFSPDSQLIVSAGDDKAITTWSMSTATELFQLDRDAGKRIVYLGFNGPGTTLLSADEAGTISEWNLKNRTRLRQLQDSDRALGSAASSFSGQYIAFGTLWSGLQKGSTNQSNVSVKPNNTSDDSNSRNVLNDRAIGISLSSVIRPTDLYRESRIKLYDADRLAVVKTLDGINGTVVSISLSADDRFVAIARERISESFLSIYDTLRNSEVVSFPSTGNVRTVVFSHDGKSLASSTVDGLVTIYAVEGIRPGGTVGDLRGTKFSVITSQSGPLLSADAILAVGVTDFEALQVDHDTAESVAQLLRTRMVGNSKITLLDRTKMLRIIREQNSQNSLLIGSAQSAATFRIKVFLTRNGHPFNYLDVDRDADVRDLLDRFRLDYGELPVLICRGEAVLKNPANEEIAQCLGFNERIDQAQQRDVVIVGAGPAGLAAALYAASEGLDALVIESSSPGGQAGSSSKIENYLGFPTGISGQELAERAYSQAQKFGASVMIARGAAGLICEPKRHGVQLADGATISARTVIIATGLNIGLLCS
jgi:WD40 repeat protein